MENLDSMYYNAKSLIRSGEYQKLNKARDILNNLLTEKMDNKVIYSLGNLETKAGNYDIARYYFESLINTEYNNRALSSLFDIEKTEMNFDKAKYYCDELLYIDSENSNYLANKAKLKIIEGNYEEAEECYQKAISKDKTNSIIYLIYLEIKRGNNKQAYEYFTNLINNNEIDFLAYDQLYKLEYYFKNKINSFNKNLYINNYYNKKTSIFFNNINTSIMLERAKKAIKKENFIDNKLIDFYTTEMDITVGTHNTVETKWVKILTLPNSKDILTVFPTYPINPQDKKFY